MHDWIDGSLYPDTSVPDEVSTLDERVDFLARLCSAWDFGTLPRQETVTEVTRPSWRDAVDSCQLLTSPTYHLLREWHGLSPVPYLGDLDPRILDDPELNQV